MTTIVVICSILYLIGVFDIFDDDMIKRMNAVFERRKTRVVIQRITIPVFIVITSPLLMVNGVLVVVSILIFLLNKLLGFR